MFPMYFVVRLRCFSRKVEPVRKENTTGIFLNVLPDRWALTCRKTTSYGGTLNNVELIIQKSLQVITEFSK